MRIITKTQYYTLIGLREMARVHWEMLNSLEKLALDITGEKAECSYTEEYIHGQWKLEELLNILNIKIKK